MKTDVQRQAIVSLLEQYDIPLIEDDVYSELYFSEHKPKPAQLYSEKGLVMTCSSFSKTAAPGYRQAGYYRESMKNKQSVLSAHSHVLHLCSSNGR